MFINRYRITGWKHFPEEQRSVNYILHSEKRISSVRKDFHPQGEWKFQLGIVCECCNVPIDRYCVWRAKMKKNLRTLASFINFLPFHQLYFCSSWHKLLHAKRMRSYYHFLNLPSLLRLIRFSQSRSVLRLTYYSHPWFQITGKNFSQRFNKWMSILLIFYRIFVLVFYVQRWRFSKRQTCCVYFEEKRKKALRKYTTWKQLP